MDNISMDFFEFLAQKYGLSPESLMSLIKDLDIYLSKFKNVPCVFNMN